MKKTEIKAICQDCKKEPESDKEQSTSSWKVYPTKCPACGGKIVPRIG